MKLIGTTIGETAKVLSAGRTQSPKSNGDWAVLLMRFIFSAILLSFAIWTIVNDKHADIGKGMIGFVAGYWLK